MKVYIIYCINDYADAVAITTNQDEAYKHVKEWNKQEGYKRFFIETRILDDTIVDITTANS